MVLYPLILIVSASFSDIMEVMKGKVWLLPKGINLESYKAVFRDDEILRGYRNTLIYTSLGVTINLIMTVAGAYPLSRKDFYGRNALTVFITFTMFFSGGMIPTYIIVKSLGFYNNLWVMVIPNAINVFNLIIMRSFFENSIPVEMQEAAFIDGATNIGILTKIVLPLSRPALAVMMMFYGAYHWNAFFIALIYLSDNKRYPLQLVLREILLQNQMGDMAEGETLVKQFILTESLKYAVIVIASAPIMLLFPFLQRYFEKGVMVGAIKG